MDERVPPSNLELESSFIGEILIEPAILKKATIRPDEFYSERNGKIYAECQRIFDSTGTVDILLVSDAMASTTQGIASYLSYCVSQVASTASWSYHEEALVRLHKARVLLEQSIRIQDMMYATPQLADEACMEIAAVAKKIHATGRVDILPYSEVITHAYEAVVKRSDHPGAISGVTFGIPDLDYFTDGLQAGEVVVVGARPGMGKTAFSYNIMLSAAKEGTRVGLVNLEMNAKQMGIRAMSTKSGMGVSDLRRGKVWDWERLNAAAAELHNLPIWVTNSSFTASKISRAIDSMANKGCKLVILDYIQLVQPDGVKARSREQEVAEVSRMIKRKAQELDISIVALAQINRQAEGSDGRPSIHHLRESGALEQDADMVILLHHLTDECECPADCFCGKRNTVEVIVGKGRSTGVGKFEVRWDPTTTTFSSKLSGPTSVRDTTGG